MVMMVILSIILALVAGLGKDTALSEFTLGKCFIYVFGAYGGLAVRRWSLTPVNISTRSEKTGVLNLFCVARIIFISVLVLGSLIHWHWKASIISYLSVERAYLPFTSTNELLTSSYQVKAT